MGVLNYTNALNELQRAVHPLVRYAGARDADRAPHRLPARLRDRVPRRKVAERAVLLVIVPFFVTFLIRTLSWKTILADSGFVVERAQTLGIL